MRLRLSLKILHTLAAAGLIGGLACYMILLVMAPQDNAAAYADLRESIALLSDWVLIPSLAVGLVSGLLAMAFHAPFMDKGWAWAKTIMGILMFKGVLTVVGSKADHAAALARRIENGEAERAVLDSAMRHEWGVLWIVMALSVANVVLGVWRPRFARPARSGDAAQPREEATPGMPKWMQRPD